MTDHEAEARKVAEKEIADWYWKAITRWRKAMAPGPSTSNSPMCDTSNSPAAWRTARCSAMSPAYSTGMSQPPKGTILAPISRWTPLRGVLRSVPDANHVGKLADGQAQYSALPMPNGAPPYGAVTHGREWPRPEHKRVWNQERDDSWCDYCHVQWPCLEVKP